MRLFYRRNRQACLITLFFTLLVVGTAIWFTQILRGSYRQTSEALVRAETARDDADLARRRAEDALARQQQEREFAVALFNSRREGPVESALFLINFLMMKETITLPVIENALLAMDKAIAENPSKSKRLWALKGHLLFVAQRFDEAEGCFAVRVGDQGPVRALIPEFAPLLREDGLLPVSDFIRLLDRLSKDSQSRYPLMEKMIIFDSMKRNSPVDSAKIVEAMLHFSNPDWKAPVFVYKPAERHLRLSARA